jgi:hypothetical protein
MTLARRHRAKHKLDDAGRIDRHLCALTGRTGIQLDRIGDTNPAIPTTLPRFGAASLKSRPIGQLGGAPQRCRVVAAVIN